MKNFIVILFILLLSPALIAQTTINVPGDYPTIQAAINSANNGDLVLVADGTYYENINFMGKAITVASHFIQDSGISHITSTVIDGSSPSNPDSGTVVMIKNGEDTNSVLCGFTITGGTGTKSGDLRGGAGIVVYYSGAKIINNIIESNSLSNVLSAYGGGIFTRGSNVIIKNNIIQNNNCNGTNYAIGGGILVRENDYALISNNIIRGNTILGGTTATGGGIDCWGPIDKVHIISNLIKGNTVETNNLGGGGIDIYDCTPDVPLIENNIIVDNHSSLLAGGILVDLSSDEGLKPKRSDNRNKLESGEILAEQNFTNNTIYNNSAGSYGGAVYSYDMTSNIMNSIVWGNTAIYYPIFAGNVNVTYSDVEDGWMGTGNIDSNPMFAAGSEYYFLDPASPCIDAGNPDPLYNDMEDPLNPGDPMPPAYGTLRNDIGHCGGPNSCWCYLNWPVPVELSSFTAVYKSGKVDLYWTTATETNNLGFEIQRKTTGKWEKIGFVKGYGTTTQEQQYIYQDNISNINASVLIYRLKQIDFDGGSAYSNEVLVELSMPADYTLNQNFPNPFNPSTTIQYNLPVKSQVDLTVYNTLGEKVLKLVDEVKEAGRYNIEFNSSGLSSGVYFYRIKAGDFIQVRKMILLK